MDLHHRRARRIKYGSMENVDTQACEYVFRKYFSTTNKVKYFDIKSI